MLKKRIPIVNLIVQIKLQSFVKLIKARTCRLLFPVSLAVPSLANRAKDFFSNNAGVTKNDQ